MQGEISGVVRQISGLIVLAGCAYLAVPQVKPKWDILPAAEKPEPIKESKQSPEVRQFMRLPPRIQRQVLDYASNWIDANFERAE